MKCKRCGFEVKVEGNIPEEEYTANYEKYHNHSCLPTMEIELKIRDYLECIKRELGDNLMNVLHFLEDFEFKRMESKLKNVEASISVLLRNIKEAMLEDGKPDWVIDKQQPDIIDRPLNKLLTAIEGLDGVVIPYNIIKDQIEPLKEWLEHRKEDEQHEQQE